jgi:hypothetical protein
LHLLSKNEEEDIEAILSLKENSNKLILSGLFNFFEEERSFKLESCNTPDTVDCYLWMEVVSEKR